MTEVWAYLAIIAASILAITFNISGGFSSLFQAFHHAAFQVGSIITTTGFSTVDFNQWPGFSRTILVTLMFVGACAGSTGGGIGERVRWIKIRRALWNTVNSEIQI